MFNKITQIGLPLFTIAGFLLTSMKMPEYGLMVALASQIFWIPSSYRWWKEAGQWGIFISTLVITLITLFGTLNYWIPVLTKTL